ncbi:MAG TPA: hypothetical protein GX012_02775, partial [Acholeplasma sp.]|nr:hypothetical protein [Acholeplasma sp.]
ERIELLESTEKLFDELHFLKSENKEEQKLIDDVAAFKHLKYTTKELSELLFVDVFLGFVPDNRWDFFKDYTSRVKQGFINFEENESGHHVLLYLDKEDSNKQLTQLERFGFVVKELPVIDETFSDYIKSKEKIINDNKVKINALESKLNKLADEKEIEFEILVDQMLSQKERKLVIYNETNADVIFDGWISNDHAGDLQSIVKKVTLEYQLEFEEPTKFDNVPTLLENNKFVQPFESITNSYSVPNYREIDPNPIMSIWYCILFGLMFGDIGYGLLLLIGTGVILKYKKPKGEFGSTVKIFFYASFATILAGIVYGSLFGVNLVGIVGNWFGKTWEPLLDPMYDPITMLIFSLGVGVLQLMTGLVMRIVLSIKQKDIISGLSDGLSWLLILLGLSAFAVSLAGDSFKVLSNVGIVLIILGLAALLIFGGMKKKGVFGKIFGGLGGVAGITTYLSDILSYSRVLALALSSTVIAFTFNLLAGLIQGSFIGFVLSLVVYFIGHAFNFAISLLSAYVHGNRLQYLEFYNRFYQGGGYLFKPLTFDLKNINEITK